MQGVSLPFSPKCTSCLAAVWCIIPIYFSDEQVFSVLFPIYKNLCQWGENQNKMIHLLSERVKMKG